MKTKSNYQDVVKIVAIFTMIIDHLGLYFFPEYSIMRIIGRTAMPIFCFFAGYNFKPLSSVNKPKLPILCGGIFLYIASAIILKQFSIGNILISIYIGQWYLYLFRNRLKKISECYIHVIGLIILGSATGIFSKYSDYGGFAIAIMVSGYTAAKLPEFFKSAAVLAMGSSVTHTFMAFNFAIFYIPIIIMFGILEYLFMTFKHINHKISLNLNLITRHTLLIYILHLIIIQIVFSARSLW